MDYVDVLGIIRKATINGVIEWGLDFPRDRQPLIIPGIEFHFFHFKATAGEFDLYFSPFWEHYGDYHYDDPITGSLLVFELEVVDRHGDNIITSDPRSKCNIEPVRLDLLDLYLVVLWNYLRYNGLKFFEVMYDYRTRRGEVIEFIPIGWDIKELVYRCA